MPKAKRLTAIRLESVPTNGDEIIAIVLYNIIHKLKNYCYLCAYIIFIILHLMQFNNLELAAVLKVGHSMVMADGKVDPNELTVLFTGMAEFGVSEEHLKMLMALADAMTPSTMLATLAALNESQKKFVCGYLATIMISDGDIDDSEIKLWQLTSALAGFPKMTIEEANQYWINH